MKSCKKPVYKSMCENDMGIRTGGRGKVKYESRPKKGHYKPKTSRGVPARGPSSKSSKRKVRA